MTTTRQYRDTPVDVKLVLGALWVTTLFVFAYVDIFGFYRADVLDAALAGTMASTTFTVDQLFLITTLVYLRVEAEARVSALHGQLPLLDQPVGGEPVAGEVREDESLAIRPQVPTGAE